MLTTTHDDNFYDSTRLGPFSVCAGIGHQVVTRGSLAISLPSINFHSDAEIEELRAGEEEIAGLKR